MEEILQQQQKNPQEVQQHRHPDFLPPRLIVHNQLEGFYRVKNLWLFTGVWVSHCSTWAVKISSIGPSKWPCQKKIHKIKDQLCVCVCFFSFGSYFFWSIAVYIYIYIWKESINWYRGMFEASKVWSRKSSLRFLQRWQQLDPCWSSRPWGVRKNGGAWNVGRTWGIQTQESKAMCTLLINDLCTLLINDLDGRKGNFSSQVFESRDPASKRDDRPVELQKGW